MPFLPNVVMILCNRIALEHNPVFTLALDSISLPLVEM